MHVYRRVFDEYVSPNGGSGLVCAAGSIVGFVPHTIGPDVGYPLAKILSPWFPPRENLTATLLCSAAEARAMVAGGRGGVIVHVSSGETMRSAPMLSVYAASKAAINHLTKSMAVELGPSGIRVLAVAPGTTPTEHIVAAMSQEHLDAIAASTPLQRACTPDDLANLILLLVSDSAAAVTGQFVLADMGAHIALQRPASVPSPPNLRR